MRKIIILIFVLATVGFMIYAIGGFYLPGTLPAGSRTNQRAVREKNPSLCERIRTPLIYIGDSAEMWQAECYKEVGIALNDLPVCLKSGWNYDCCMHISNSQNSKTCAEYFNKNKK